MLLGGLRLPVHQRFPRIRLQELRRTLQFPRPVAIRSDLAIFRLLHQHLLQRLHHVARTPRQRRGML